MRFDPDPTTSLFKQPTKMVMQFGILSIVDAS
jgi:hypothetical protein